MKLITDPTWLASILPHVADLGPCSIGAHGVRVECESVFVELRFYNKRDRLIISAQGGREEVKVSAYKSISIVASSTPEKIGRAICKRLVTPDYVALVRLDNTSFDVAKQHNQIAREFVVEIARILGVGATSHDDLPCQYARFYRDKGGYGRFISNRDAATVKIELADVDLDTAKRVAEVLRIAPK